MNDTPIGKQITAEYVLDKFTAGRYNKDQYLSILDGALISGSIILTTGPFLSGYIIFLGGSDFLVGLLNSSMAWALVAALAASFIYEMMERRKKALIFFVAVSRLLLCSIIFLPLITQKNSFAIVALSVMVIAGNILWCFYTTGANVWVMSIAPAKSRNGYIYRRTFWLRISFTSLTILMGFVLDWFQKSYTGFFIVFASALMLSIIDVTVLLNIGEPVNAVRKDKGNNVRIIFEPLKNISYRKYLAFILLFYLGLFISASFTPLYLIRYLKFDYKFISLIFVISYLFMIISTRFWSVVEAKRSLSFVIKMAAFFIISELLVYSFLTEKTYYLLYFAPVLAGIGNGGFNIAIFNFRYGLMPDDNKTIYEAWFGVALGLGTIVAPVIGGFLLNVMPAVNNTVYRHSSFQLLYLTSFLFTLVIILLSFHKPKTAWISILNNRRRYHDKT